MEEGIAIIGIGCRYPGADNREMFWENIINKVNAIIEVPRSKWDTEIYYHPDREIPDKTYSKIGGFVNDIDKTAVALQFEISEELLDSMDMTHTSTIVAVGEAIKDSGYEKKDFDRERTAVIIGNSRGGDIIDYTNLRIFFGKIQESLNRTGVFSNLDSNLRMKILTDFERSFKGDLPEITKDSMTGELADDISGRIADFFDLNRPNFSIDAVCVSSMASLSESIKGLRMREFDMAIAGGTDYIMGPAPYVKFCKIGALSPDGSRPFDAGANGFVMGEGTGIYILKRVSDARKDGDKIYAVIRGMGASSDGKGKEITAPNLKGQALAIERGLKDGGFTPESVQYIEAYGASTTEGDYTELMSLLKVWENISMKPGSICITSVKSMIGHLKAAAGSASVIKTALALSNKTFGPSINYQNPNPHVDFESIPFRVITDPEKWPNGVDGNPRRAGISAFGFGGSNFHVTIEEDAGYNGMPETRRQYASGFKGTGERKPAEKSSSEAGAERLTVINSFADVVRAKIVEIVSEKTGYPGDFIGFDLYMEGDLGIDKLKQEEIFRSVCKFFNISRDENIRIMGFPTLGHVVRFVQERSPEIAAQTDLALVTQSMKETTPAVSIKDTGFAQERSPEVVARDDLALVTQSMKETTPAVSMKGPEREYDKIRKKLGKKKFRYPMIDRLVDLDPGVSLVVRKRVYLSRDIYLSDCDLHSESWFPGVMGIESFAEAARLFYPKMNIKLLRNVIFLVPLKIMKNEPIEIIIKLKKKDHEGKDILLDAFLEREVIKSDGAKPGDMRLHLQGEILLSGEKRSFKKMKELNKVKNDIEKYKEGGKFILKKKEIYTRFFHGSLFQALESVISINKSSSMSAMVRRNDNIFSFSKKPELISEPLVIETALQNSGIYAIANLGINSLPCSMEEVVFRSIPAKVKELYAISEFRGTDGEKQVYDTRVFDREGNIYSVMKGCRMINTGALPEELKIPLK